MLRSRYLLVLILLLVSPPALAQTVSATTGAITGRVTDGTSAVVPGVSVTLSGSAVMGPRSAVTDAEGLYGFGQLPPGEYALLFELAGFTTIRREGIRVSVGFTATVPIEVSLATVQETVTITGESPVVDTRSTEIATIIGAKQLDTLPGSRDFWAMLAVATPAVQMNVVDVGGNTALRILGHVVYGTSSQHRYMQEGLDVTEGNGFMGYSDWGSFEEMGIQAAAHSAEMPNPGVFAQFVSKSGGNRYSGRLLIDYSPKSFGTTNIDAAQIAAGVRGGPGVVAEELNRTELYRDFNADVGGYIKKDTLWWYSSYRNTATSKRLVNLPGIPQETSDPIWTGKLTYSLSKNNKFIGYMQRSNKIQQHYLDDWVFGASGIHDNDSPYYEEFPHGIWKVEYNRPLGSSMFLEVRAGNYFYDFIGERRTEALRVNDIGANTHRGGTLDIVHTRGRRQALGSLSYSRSGWIGTHDFKVGAEMFRELVTNTVTGYPEHLRHMLNNGVPIEIYLVETPSENSYGQFSAAGYLNDVWRLSHRWTLNLGLRLDRWRAFLPAQEHAATRFNPQTITFDAIDNLNTFTNWAPRIGVIHTLDDAGKTALKFNYGQYWWNPSANFAGSSNPNSILWYRRYAWTDPNANGRWDPGEEGRLIATSGGAASERLSPNLKNTFTREVAAWLEREVMADFGLRTGFVWRGERQGRARVNLNQPFAAFNVPITISDPGPDGRLSTSDDGAGIPGFDLSPQYLGLPTVSEVVNIPNSDSDFYTWEVTGTKRMRSRWALGASFAHTWSRDAVDALNPNQLINTEGGRNHFTTWQAKVTSSIELPASVLVTPIVRHQSGTPYGRTFSPALQYGNPTVRAELFSARRHPNITVFDLRVEKQLRIPGAGRLISGYADLYNVFNANPAIRLNTTSGGSWLTPLEIVGPRVARIGARLEW